jgi:hypothetical protein
MTTSFTITLFLASKIFYRPNINIDKQFPLQSQYLEVADSLLGHVSVRHCVQANMFDELSRKDKDNGSQVWQTALGRAGCYCN